MTSRVGKGPLWPSWGPKPKPIRPNHLLPSVKHLLCATGLGQQSRWRRGAAGAGTGRAARVWSAPPPAPQHRCRGSLHALPSVSTSENICFFSGRGWGTKRRKKARGGQGLPILLSTLARPSVIECSFPVAGPAQRGPFMASPWLPGNQATASAPRPLNSSSKPLHQQLPGPGKGERAASRLRASEVGT